jgi:RNA polymerase sigma-32 factor
MKINKKKQQNLNKNLPARIDSHLPIASDPFKVYLSRISKYPVLTLEEEQKLIEKMLKGDADATKLLIISNLRLVVKIALEYRNTYQNIMDLIQEGNIGLMKAISMYNPEKGAKLSYYASWWIKSYILKFLIDNFRLVKIGTTQAQKKLFYNLIKEQQNLEQEGKKALTFKLSKTLDVKEEEVTEMANRLDSSSEFSIDQKISEDSDSTYLSSIQDNTTRPDLIVEEKSEKLFLRRQIQEFAKNLNEKEKIILKDRLLSETPLTLQEIANRFGISKERTRQLEERIIKQLRDQLKEIIKPN